MWGCGEDRSTPTGAAVSRPADSTRPAVSRPPAPTSTVSAEPQHRPSGHLRALHTHAGRTLSSTKPSSSAPGRRQGPGHVHRGTPSARPVSSPKSGATSQSKPAPAAPQITELAGRRRVTISGGGVAYLPPLPATTVVAPSDSCVREPDPKRGIDPLPPRPGLRASRVDEGTLLVTITFASIPDNCRPDYVELNLDVNDDPLPPVAGRFALEDVRQPLRIPIPSRVRGADVISASSVISSSGASDSGPIRITPR